MREPMRDRSGASAVDPADFTVSLHGRKLLDLIEHPFGAVSTYSVLKTMPDAGQMAIINPLLNWFVARGSVNIATVARAGETAARPTLPSGRVLLAGNNRLFEELRAVSSWLIDRLFHETGRTSVSTRSLSERCAPTAKVPRHGV